MKQNIRSMTCNCCGVLCKGRQWWNRDAGYSICAECATRQEKTYGREEVEELNGKFGIHHSI